jgi:site-specific recombinase XerD
VRPADVHRLTIAEAADRYTDMVRAKTLTGVLAPGTAEVYARDVCTFARLAGGKRILDDLAGEDVDEVLLAFARKPDGRRAAAHADVPRADAASQSGASQARFRRSVSAFFRHATVTGWVQLDPMRVATVVPRSRGGLRPERRALTREQAEGLLGTARRLAAAPPDRRRRADQRTELRDALIVLLLATVGPRVSELTRADVEHFYLNAGVRYWRIFGKGGPTRDVPLPHEVSQVLDAYLAWRRTPTGPTGPTGGAGALLLSWRGNRLARGDVQAVIDRVLARVDPRHRRGVTPHGLRHTTATHLLAAATDLDVVRRVLGHSDLSTLGRYRDELPGELEAAMRVHPLLAGPEHPGEGADASALPG